jgi:hypothetical protein
VVYDREGETKYTDAIHAEARQKAESAGIEIALSNVCFEVWLLLHFQTNVAPYANCEDLLRSSALKTRIVGYDKADKREYTQEEIDFARRNAARVNTQTIAGADRAWTQAHQWNPYTNVHELLDAIDTFGEKYVNKD